MSAFLSKVLMLFAAFASLWVGTNATEELTAARYEALTTSGQNGMIKFYQPWCGHCTRMKPDWDKLSESAPSSVFIADINCTDEDELCSKQGVQGYPTIKVFKDGKVENYEGGRSLEELTEFVNTQLAVQCDISDLENSGCSEKAVQYATKWQGKKAQDVALVAKELSRLTGMMDQSMTSDLKSWLRERVSILKQLSPEAKA